MQPLIRAPNQGQTVITLASQQMWIGLGIVGFLFVSLTMILIVLIQKPQGGGLSGAFGSSSDGGSGQTAFGAKTGDVLTTMTIAVFVIFLVSAAGLNYLIRPPELGSGQQQMTSGGTGSGPAPAGNQTPPAQQNPTAPPAQSGSGGPINMERMDGPPPGFNADGTPIAPPAGDTPPVEDPVDGSPEQDQPGDDSNPEG